MSGFFNDIKGITMRAHVVKNLSIPSPRLLGVHQLLFAHLAAAHEITESGVVILAALIAAIDHFQQLVPFLGFDKYFIQLIEYCIVMNIH